MPDRSRTVSIAIILSMFAALGTARAARPDAWITMKVKWQLLTDAGVAGTSVNVDTADRRVTLHGRVPSISQSLRAAELARAVKGVREVRNLLLIAPSDAEAARSEALRGTERSRREGGRSLPPLPPSDPATRPSS